MRVGSSSRPCPRAGRTRPPLNDGIRAQRRIRITHLPALSGGAPHTRVIFGSQRVVRVERALMRVGDDMPRTTGQRLSVRTDCVDDLSPAGFTSAVPWNVHPTILGSPFA